MQAATDTTLSPPTCLECRAVHVVRNGRNAGRPTVLPCRACGRQFVERPRAGPVTDGTKCRVERLLAERVALRAGFTHY